MDNKRRRPFLFKQLFSASLEPGWSLDAARYASYRTFFIFYFVLFCFVMLAIVLIVLFCNKTHRFGFSSIKRASYFLLTRTVSCFVSCSHRFLYLRDNDSKRELFPCLVDDTRTKTHRPFYHLLSMFYLFPVRVAIRVNVSGLWLDFDHISSPVYM